MSRCVLDASVVLAWSFKTDATGRADQVMSEVARHGALVPAVWPLEVANGVRIAVRQSVIERPHAEDLLRAILALPIGVEGVSPTRALTTIHALALQTGLTAYDASYLELARRIELPLCTLDRYLAAACKAPNVALA